MRATQYVLLVFLTVTHPAAFAQFGVPDTTEYRTNVYCQGRQVYKHRGTADQVRAKLAQSVSEAPEDFPGQCTVQVVPIRSDRFDKDTLAFDLSLSLVEPSSVQGVICTDYALTNQDAVKGRQCSARGLLIDND
jgi:hypothetical protein